MKKTRRRQIPLGYLGQEGYKRFSNGSIEGQLFVEEGLIPFGARTFKSLKEGDIVLYKRAEDRDSAEVQFALVEVVGSPGAVLIDVLFHKAYSGSTKQVAKGSLHAAASYELFWDRQTPVNPQLEKALRDFKPQLL